MWVFKGCYTGDAKAYRQAKEKKQMAVLMAVFSIVIMAIGIPMAIFLGEGDPILTATLLCTGIGAMLAVDCILSVFYKQNFSSEIRITNDGFEISSAAGNVSFPFYKIAPVEYYDQFIVVRGKVVLQKELLCEGEWEELKNTLKRIEESLDTEEPIYQLESPETEFFDAVVCSKRIFKSFSGWVQAPTSELHYFASFKLPSGDVQEYEIGRELYESVSEGQRGTLVVVNGSFFAFGDGENA